MSLLHSALRGIDDIKSFVNSEEENTHTGKSKKRPVWNYMMGEEQIKKTKVEKDLRVIIQENLNPEKHKIKIFGLSYKMLTNIRVAFHYIDKI